MLIGDRLFCRIRIVLLCRVFFVFFVWGGYSICCWGCWEGSGGGDGFRVNNLVKDIYVFFTFCVFFKEVLGRV